MSISVDSPESSLTIVGTANKQGNLQLNYGTWAPTSESRLMKICEAQLPDKFSNFWSQLNSTDWYTQLSFADGGYGAAATAGNEYVRHTNMYTFGLLMHEGLSKSPLWTRNCSEADAVFVFYDLAVELFFQSLLGKKIEDSISELFGTRRLAYLPHLLEKPHFFPISKCELDFLDCSWLYKLKVLWWKVWHWGSDIYIYNTGPALKVHSFLCHERAYDNMIYWTLEKKFGKSHNQALAFPYPSHIHFQRSTVAPGAQLDATYGATGPDQMNGTTRDLFAFGTWSNRLPGLRPRLSQQCLDRPGLCVYYMPPQFSDAEAGTYYPRSVFCLQPRGDTPTRSSFWDGIGHGCINVLFERKIHFPFSRWFDWDRLVVYVDEARLKRENVIDILQAIPPEEIASRQAYINSVRHAFQYSLEPSWETVTSDKLDMVDPRDDAHTLAVKEAFLKAAEALPSRPAPHN